MKSILSTCVIAATAVMAQGLLGGGGEVGGVPGGTTSADVEETKPWLYKALATSTSSFVCVSRIVSVDQQVVAGMHYTFHVLACPVSSKHDSSESCAVAHCASDVATRYAIDVYSKPGKESVELKSVTKETVHEVLVGGWSEGSLVDATSEFYAAVQSESSYANAAIPRICAIDLLSVNQQVVSGMNYQFHVRGCPVPTASAAKYGCTCGDSAVQGYTIAIFAQSWTDTYKVTDVTTDTPLLGGWTLRTIEDADKERFFQAMDADTSNAVHVCPLIFDSLQAQVVAGTNYRYHVNGCPIEDEDSSSRVHVADGCPGCTAALAKKFEVTIHKPLVDAPPSVASVIDLSRVSLGMQSHRSENQVANSLALLAVLVSGVVVVSLLLVYKLRRSQYEKLNNMQLAD
ncbi:hypothetical protein DYB28_003014 [Aphanomyces astaci]|uniref:Cystatin domain-containing protein n=1 Tax=Aphanomyces astaci TaxID=112090 RepID=A0A3L6VI85_APHAT|nr:hypothetical protein AaE_004863 [Aphanomyces astaci]RLO08625.1 hypothetical protein DYB28_003014 [Aphanomyces astaci]